MLREHIFSGRTPTDPQFRWRGGDVSRIEGLSDAAFAFAMTFLVVESFQQGIATSGDLLHAMKDVLALACCFAIVIWVWGTHYKFFRRYGLEDNYTIFLNTALLFTVMVYVYPLKFLFSFVINILILRDLPVDPVTNKAFNPVASQDTIALMQVYAAGYILIFVLFALLVHHAYRQREKLQLDEMEVLLTRSSIKSHLLTASIGVVSIAITVIPWPFHQGIATGASGMIYGINGPVQWWWGSRVARRAEALEKKLLPEPSSDTPAG